MQRGYQKDIVEANRNALKSEAGAQLARLQLKKDEHIRLCAMRRWMAEWSERPHIRVAELAGPAPSDQLS